MYRHCCQKASSRQDCNRKKDIKTMAKFPLTQNWHKKHYTQRRSRHDNGSKEFTRRPPALKNLEKLEQKKKVPFRSGGSIRFGRIGRRTKFCSKMTGNDWFPCKNCSQRWQENHSQNNCHHSKHRNRIFEHLIWPKHCIGTSDWLLSMQAMFAKQRKMQDKKENQRCRQKSRM